MAFSQQLIDTLESLSCPPDAFIAQWEKVRKGDNATSEMEAWYKHQIGPVAQQGSVWKAAYEDAMKALKK